MSMQWLLIMVSTIFVEIAAIATAVTGWFSRKEWLGKGPYPVVESFSVSIGDVPDLIPGYRIEIKNYGGRPARGITAMVASWDMGIKGELIDPRQGPVQYDIQTTRTLEMYTNKGVPDPRRFTTPNDLPPGATLPFTWERNVLVVPSQWVKIIITYRDANDKNQKTNEFYYAWGGIEAGKERFPPSPLSEKDRDRFERILNGDRSEIVSHSSTLPLGLP